MPSETKLQKKRKQIDKQIDGKQEQEQEKAYTKTKKQKSGNVAHVFYDESVSPATTRLSEHTWNRWTPKKDRLEFAAPFQGDRLIFGYGLPKHGFIGSMTWAYSEHLPVQFGPQHVWLMTMQGIAQHISVHAERLKHVLMKRSDRGSARESVVIRRDDFQMGSDHNDWSSIIVDFRKAIQSLIGDGIKVWYHQATQPFSCSSESDVIATEVALLETMHHYVDMVLMTKCGFPEIKLEGTEADWLNLKQRVLSCRDLDTEDAHFSNWLIQVESLVDAILGWIREPKYDAEKVFWNSMIRSKSQSGKHTLDGWFHTLIPYLVEEAKAEEPLTCPKQHMLVETDNPYHVNGNHGFKCDGCSTTINFGSSQHCAECKFDLCDYCAHRRRHVRTWIPNPSALVHWSKVANDPNPVDIHKIPDGISRAPFVWNYLGQNISMTFESGFVSAAELHESSVLRPHVTWCVRRS